ncbi:MAG: hypothetical protein IJP17_05155, partial [Clostridia bacterium]|nr:hypothetical protein [Clostridia bacterium]
RYAKGLSSWDDSLFCWLSPVLDEMKVRWQTEIAISYQFAVFEWGRLIYPIKLASLRQGSPLRNFWQSQKLGRLLPRRWLIRFRRIESAERAFVRRFAPR